MSKCEVMSGYYAGCNYTARIKGRQNLVCVLVLTESSHLARLKKIIFYTVCFRFVQGVTGPWLCGNEGKKGFESEKIRVGIL